MHTVSGNTIEGNVSLVVDNEHNYQDYDVRSKYNVAAYVGRNGGATVDNNTGSESVSIVWNGIPESI